MYYRTLWHSLGLGALCVASQAAAVTTAARAHKPICISIDVVCKAVSRVSRAVEMRASMSFLRSSNSRRVSRRGSTEEWVSEFPRALRLGAPGKAAARPIAPQVIWRALAAGLSSGADVSAFCVVLRLATHPVRVCHCPSAELFPAQADHHTVRSTALGPCSFAGPVQ